MTEDEFNFRKTRPDPFVLGIINAPKLMIIGDETDFVQASK